MNEDRALSLAMEAHLIKRAKAGPNADPPVSERKVPRASVLAGAAGEKGCLRRVYYWLVGAPEDPLDALGACAFQDGKDLEDGILDDALRAVKESAPWSAPLYQQACETPWYRGSADMVLLQRQPVGEPSSTAASVWDAKSANPAAFDITVKKGEVSDTYVAQLSLYAAALGATECVVVYRQKGGTRKGNPQVYAVFRFPPDLALVESLKAKAIEAMDARDGHAPIPERVKGANPKAFPCSYCSFVTYCHGQP